MKRKLVVNDGRSEREVLLVGPIVIGRDPSCHISDLDPLLSRRHAEFVPRPTGLLVRDLGSRNGILVNGSKVPERMLTSGDVVQLGHLQLRYVEEEITELHDLRHAEDTEPHHVIHGDDDLARPNERASSTAADGRRPQAQRAGVRHYPRRQSASETTLECPVPVPTRHRIASPAIDVTNLDSENDDEDTHIPRAARDDDETVAPHSSTLCEGGIPRRGATGRRTPTSSCDRPAPQAS